jgi:rSAM/selenodomain-associated transferase 1
VKARRHVVVFAKAPRLGTVKRRLAAGIGAVAALRFHRTNTDALLWRLSSDPRWRCRLAITPDRFAVGPRFWRCGAPRLPQGGGDLGTRMERALRALPPGPVLIVGADIPGIGREQIARAFRVLAEKDFVFGPAPDGGYWLIGARRRRQPRILRGVRWSTEAALADTLASLPKGMSVGYVETLEDIDTAEEYRRWRRR